VTTFGDGAFGLLIGVEEFRDPQYAKQPLPHAGRDANDFASTLVQSLGWRADHLEVLTGVVTKDAVAEGFGRVSAKIEPGEKAELFLLYISTHGHPYKAVRRAYEVTLLTTDGELEKPLRMFDSTLTRHFLGFCIDTVQARQKAVIVDACYAALAATADDLVPFDSRELDAAVLASSTRRSYALRPDRNSEFTAALLEGIRTLNGRRVGLTDLFSLASQNRILEPYLDSKGRYIALGASTPAAPKPAAPKPQLTADSFTAFFTAQLDAVAESARHNPLSDSYVTRTEIERRFDQLLGERPKRIAVVGPPGGGKTTFLLRSASRAINAGAGVLWIGPTGAVKERSAAAVVDRALAPLGEELTFATAIGGAQLRGPWLVVLDGVNEWPTPPNETQRRLLDFAAVAADNGATLALSCREESWRILREAFGAGKSAPNADIVLSNFDDAEVREIAARFGRGLPAAIVSVLRRPLFVRMLLDARAAFADHLLDLGELFEAYVASRSDAIADRLGVDAAAVVGALRAYARWLLEQRAETMPVERFFQTMSDALAIAVLEEGLCGRNQGAVGFESETLLEYLISLDLPEDPFDGVDLGERCPTDTWWGAAAFKAARLEPARLQAVLETLVKDWRSQEYALSLVARSRNPILHLSVVESLVGNEHILDDTLKRFMNELLDRGGASQTTLVLRAVRSFAIGNYGSWREKDWSKTSPAEFDTRLAEQEEIALAVLRAHEVDPATTFATLVAWLNDDTYLADKEAHVADFASLFLKHLGYRNFDGLVAAIEHTVGEDGELPYELSYILGFVAQHREVPLAIVARWLESPHRALRSAATLLVPAVPAADTVELLAALQQLARRDDILESERARTIASIGARKSRAALNALAALSALEELQAGVVGAYVQLADDFPVEVTKRIAAFNGQAPLRSDVIEALNRFYLGNLPKAPDAGVAYFRKLQRELPGRWSRDIAYSIHTLTQSIAVVTAFVEEELSREQSGNALELFHYYLRKVRPLNDGDVPWVRRWIESGDGAYGLISYLLNGDVSYENKATLYHRLDAVGPLYGNDCYGLDERGKAFARQFQGDPRFVTLTKGGKLWIKEIAKGRSGREASRAVQEEEWRRLVSSRKRK
jgi:hypothetical protein